MSIARIACPSPILPAVTNQAKISSTLARAAGHSTGHAIAMARDDQLGGSEQSFPGHRAAARWLTYTSHKSLSSARRPS
jgi:hypothetical protein